MVEPLGATVPAPFDRGEFRSVRGKVPDINRPHRSRARTRPKLSPTVSGALITDVLPEISVVEGPSTGEEHHQRLTEPLLERPSDELSETAGNKHSSCKSHDSRPGRTTGGRSNIRTQMSIKITHSLLGGHYPRLLWTLCHIDSLY